MLSSQQFAHRGLKPAPRYEQIYNVVRQIPSGKVATYGQIAKIVDRCTARMIGYAMAALPSNTDVPWQRVINYQGQISPRSRGDGSLRQRKLLEAEGLQFDERGRVDLKKIRWAGLDRRGLRGTFARPLTYFPAIFYSFYLATEGTEATAGKLKNPN